MLVMPCRDTTSPIIVWLGSLISHLPTILAGEVWLSPQMGCFRLFQKFGQRILLIKITMKARQDKNDQASFFFAKPSDWIIPLLGKFDLSDFDFIDAFS